MSAKLSSRTWGDQLIARSDYKACARCGIERRFKSGRINLCRDCTSTLTPTERELWK